MSEVQGSKTEEYSAFQLWFVRLFVLAAALGCLYKGFEIYKSYKSTDWPFVRGKINRAWRSDHPTLPNIRYTYKVGARTYQGNTVAYRDLVGASETKRVLNRYPTGKKVNVYYNPQNHRESALEPGYVKGSGFWIIVPLAMFLIGVLLHRHVSTLRKKAVERENTTLTDEK